MVGILTEENYIKTFWGQQIFISLTERLRSKRIPYCEIIDDCYADLEAIFIIAADLGWTKSAIEQLNAGGYTPILLCNQSESLPGCIYSCVCTDIRASMKSILEAIKQKGKKRVAIYGVNNNSISDISRVNDLLLWKDKEIEAISVYYNDISFAECFNSFEKDIEKFDAVICMNDYIAISLVNHLKEKDEHLLEGMTIISCVECALIERYKNYITPVRISFDQYGQAAVCAYEIIKKHGNLSTVTLRVDCSLKGNSAESAHKSVKFSLERNDDRFYKDTEFKELHIADLMYNITDTTDLFILNALSQGKPYESIAHECYLSVGSVKYRIKRILSSVGCESKDELVTIMKKYLS